MTGIVVVDTAEVTYLTQILGTGYTLRLYTVDVTAGLNREQLDQLTTAAFTEASFPGYSAKALTGGAWTITSGNPTRGTYAQQSWVRSSSGAAELIYGYYVTRTSDGVLRWFEPFEAPVSMEFLNDTLRVTPVFTLDDSEANVVPTGMITPYGAAAAPLGWLLCDGAAVSRTTYADLFEVIGTTYGVGDGATTFNLPDMRQRFPLGKAASGTGAVLGSSGGAIDHVHGLDTASSFAQVSISGSEVFANRKGTASWTRTHKSTIAAVAAAGDSVTNASALSGDTDTENPPYLALTYIVKT